MKKLISVLTLAFVLFFIASCNPWPTIFGVNPVTGQYGWFQGRPSPGEIYAYQKEDGLFCLAKIDKTLGLKQIDDDIFAVTSTKFSKTPGVLVPCVGYQKTEGSFWQIRDLEGNSVADESDQLTSLPSETHSVAGKKKFIYY